MTEINAQMAKQLYEYSQEILTEMEVSFEKEDEGEGNYSVVIEYRDEDIFHRMVIRVFAESGVMSFSERLGFAIEPDEAPKVVEACNRVNTNINFGCFYYDNDDGYIFYYCPLLFNNSIIGKETVRELIMRTANSVGKYYDRLAAVRKGYLAPENILPEE